MAVFQWYKTHITGGVTDQPSELVDIWFGATAPADPSLYDIVIIDSNGSGAIDPDEWLAATGNAGSKARGGTDPQDAKLLDPDPAGGPTDGWIYTHAPFAIGTPNVADGLVVDFPPIDPGLIDVACFAAGTMIATPSGMRPVETLRPGDRIITRDNGMQVLRGVWSDTVSGIEHRAPVRFEAGALGNERPLLVSQNHRMLIGGPALELYFGFAEALVMAKSLCNGSSIRQLNMPSLDYVHLLFDRHELVYAEGVASESFMPQSHMVTALAKFDVDMFQAKDDVVNKKFACRPCLSHRQGLAIAASSGLWHGKPMIQAELSTAA